MDRKSRPAILAEVFRNIVCNPLSPHKNEDFRVLLADLIEMLNKLRTLFKIAADFDKLLYVVIGGELQGSDVDLDEVFQEIL